jgi:hypothetical protein
VRAEPVTARRLGRINLVAAVSFAIGGSLFALGAFLAQTGNDGARNIDLVYLVGGFFFSLGGYASVLQAGNAPTDIDPDGALTSARWRWWEFRPHNLGWLSAAVLFLGTLLFAVSLVAAFAENLTVRQSNTWIWIPDMLVWRRTPDRPPRRRSTSGWPTGGPSSGPSASSSAEWCRRSTSRNRSDLTQDG